MFKTGGTTTLPYTAPSDIVYVNQRGKIIESSDVAGLLLDGEVVYAGVPYTFKYQFSSPVLKQDKKPITTGTLKLRNYAVVYNKTGFFSVDIEPLQRDTYTRTFTGRIVGSQANILNKAAINSGTYSFGVVGNAEDTKITLKSDNHLPCNFQSAEWEGFFTLRSRRM